MHISTREELVNYLNINIALSNFIDNVAINTITTDLRKKLHNNYATGVLDYLSEFEKLISNSIEYVGMFFTISEEGLITLAYVLVDDSTVGLSDAVDEIGMFAFAFNEHLEHFSCSSVKRIQKYAFIGSNIADVESNNLEVIEKGAFRRCTHLSCLNFSNLIYIGEDGFTNSKVDSIRIEAPITLAARAFFRASIKSLILPSELYLEVLQRHQGYYLIDGVLIEAHVSQIKFILPEDNKIRLYYRKIPMKGKEEVRLKEELYIKKPKCNAFPECDGCPNFEHISGLFNPVLEHLTTLHYRYFA